MIILHADLKHHSVFQYVNDMSFSAKIHNPDSFGAEKNKWCGNRDHATCQGIEMTEPLRQYRCTGMPIHEHVLKAY